MLAKRFLQQKMEMSKDKQRTVAEEEGKMHDKVLKTLATFSLESSTTVSSDGQVTVDSQSASKNNI